MLGRFKKNRPGTEASDDQEFSLDSDASSSRENLTPPTAKVFKHRDPLDDAIFIKRQGI